jgi:hypothetical protein
MNLARAQAKLGNTVREGISRIDWHRIVEDLDARGFAVIGELLTARVCRTIASFYPDDANFRSRVVMARHGFGRGGDFAQIMHARTQDVEPRTPSL